jgi:hypothetical protein
MGILDLLHMRDDHQKNKILSLLKAVNSRGSDLQGNFLIADSDLFKS